MPRTPTGRRPGRPPLSRKSADAPPDASGRGRPPARAPFRTPAEIDAERVAAESGSHRASATTDMGIILPGENIDGSGEGPLYQITHGAVGRWAKGALVHESNFGDDKNLQRLIDLGAIELLSKKEAAEAMDDFDERIEMRANEMFEQKMAEWLAAHPEEAAKREADKGEVHPAEEHPAADMPVTNPPESTGAAVPANHPERANLPPGVPSPPAEPPKS